MFGNVRGAGRHQFPFCIFGRKTVMEALVLTGPIRQSGMVAGDQVGKNTGDDFSRTPLYLL
ncbi:hypothetical protein SDC9_204440 [bioreactor metagenome]|uniref:Uncharacterized protein n=1 Tax=bioreactor metagenome TaxID=1076179 RepID=A0A645IZ96_9ZZZZ